MTLTHFGNYIDGTSDYTNLFGSGSGFNSDYDSDTSGTYLDSSDSTPEY